VTELSVNVNKVATLRNSRGGDFPSVLDAVRTCIAAGVRGITVHPRGDERHIRRVDVHEIAKLLRETAPQVELNIEGDPRPDWLELVNETRPAQATLVPVREGETTSEAGWPASTDDESMRKIVAQLKAAGSRVSMFVDAEQAPIAWAKRVGSDRIELYTEPFARAFAESRAAAEACFERFAGAARAAHALGMGVNAGHDLDLQNLVMFRELPHLAEVSIGHALIGRALFEGLPHVVREYLACLRARAS
jgi:pyridoxine 5-phosphate synthase